MIFVRAWEAFDDWMNMLFEKLEEAVGTGPALFIWASVGISILAIYCIVSSIIIVMLINNLIDWLNATF